MRFPNIVPPVVNFFAVDDVAADVDVVVVVASVVLSSIGPSDFCA